MNVKKIEEVIQELGTKPGLDNFVNQFGLFAQGPGGINKLKEIIIGLAVIGRMSTNNSGESSSEQIEKYKTKLNKLINSKEFPKRTKLPQIENEPLQKTIPDNWNLFRFGELMDIQGGSQPPKSYFIDEPRDGYVQLIQIRDLGPKPQPVYVPSEKVTKLCNKNDILVGRYGASVGKVFWGKDGAYNVALIKILFMHEYFDAGYLHLFLRSPYFQNKILGISRSAQDGFNKGDVHPIVTPFPPLEEQKRIVSKVNELMALCDQLEAQQQQQANTLLKANTAAIQALLSSDDPQGSGKDRNSSGTNSANNKEDLKNNWQRLADNFHTLYDNTLPMPPGEGRQKKYLVGRENIKSLRQAIVELAFKGNLTTKSVADGNAFEQLEEIRVKRKIKIEAGEIKNKKIPPLTEDGIYPHHWASVRLLELTELITKGSSPKWQGVEYIEERDDAVLFVTSENVSNYSINLTKKKYVEPKFNEIEPRSILKKGDLLTNIVGASIGRTAEFDLNEIANINQAVCIIRLLESSIDKRFLLHFFNSDYCLSLMFENQVENARANLSMGNIEKFIIPFPPLEEQKRIVNKIDELMSLCDHIEQQLTTAYDQAEKLITATTKALVA